MEVMTFCLAPYRTSVDNIFTKVTFSMEVMTFCLAPYRTAVRTYLQGYLSMEVMTFCLAPIQASI